ncbi:MAG: hypothetical protein GY820_07260 [Gammaproteobacteria bacterium]|nr:hypothetical protein [Gammaproteobacteria bacterium]
MKKLDPVIFKLGSALYISQIFEGSLIFLHKLIDEDERATGVQKIPDGYSKKTLGNLLNLLKRRIDVKQHSLDYIFEAIELRNIIVHGYLVSEENMAKFESESGISSLVQDLDLKIIQIRERDHYVCTLIDQYLKKYGTSTELLKSQAEVRSWLFHENNEL